MVPDLNRNWGRTTPNLSETASGFLLRPPSDVSYSCKRPRPNQLAPFSQHSQWTGTADGGGTPLKVSV